MEQIEIRTAQNVGIAFEAAGLGDRTIAALIDYLVLAAYLISVSTLLGVVDAPSWAFFTILLLPYLSYFLLCEVFFDGQSVGKRARGLRVVRLDGRPPTLGSYLLRWLLRPVDILMTSGLAAVLCVLITGTGQRLGDLAAGTAVVKRPPDGARLGDTLFRHLGEEHALTFPQVDRLGRADAETVRDVLNALRADRHSSSARALSQRLKAGLEEKMGVTSDLSAPRFLHAVLEDYNHVQGRV